LSSTAPSPPQIYTLSLHDALPISPPQSTPKRRSRISRPRSPTSPNCRRAERLPGGQRGVGGSNRGVGEGRWTAPKRVARNSFRRSEEHTSELQSRFDLVCRLLLEK